MPGSFSAFRLRQAQPRMKCISWANKMRRIDCKMLNSTRSFEPTMFEWILIATKVPTISVHCELRPKSSLASLLYAINHSCGCCPRINAPETMSWFEQQGFILAHESFILLCRQRKRLMRQSPWQVWQDFGQVASPHVLINQGKTKAKAKAEVKAKGKSV